MADIKVVNRVWWDNMGHLWIKLSSAAAASVWIR